VKTLTVTVSYEDEVAFANFLATEQARWKIVLKDLFN